MKKFQIKNIYRRHENDINSKVEYIGGINSDGTFWKISVEKAIEIINEDIYIFYVIINNVEVDIKVNKKNDELLLNISEPILLELNKIII